jgi:hypothetical protein
MPTASEPKLPHNRDQEVPRRRGEHVDDERDKQPDGDTVPDTPPTEPQPQPMKEPPPAPDEQRGPMIVQP